LQDWQRLQTERKAKLKLRQKGQTQSPAFSVEGRLIPKKNCISPTVCWGESVSSSNCSNLLAMGLACVGVVIHFSVIKGETEGKSSIANCWAASPSGVVCLGVCVSLGVRNRAYVNLETGIRDLWAPQRLHSSRKLKLRFWHWAQFQSPATRFLMAVG